MNGQQRQSGDATLRKRRWLWVILLTTAIGVVYFANVHRNPPGYYIDESSISYNATPFLKLVVMNLVEHGRSTFRAFGDYKNPVYIYLLAGIYRVTGPSIAAARLLSAACGFLAALGLGLLATRISERASPDVGLLVAVMALLTPWLFRNEPRGIGGSALPAGHRRISSVRPLGVDKVPWSWREATCLAATLALVTYTYSIGRLVGPLFALGLIFFSARGRRAGSVTTWMLYAAITNPAANLSAT